MNNSNPITVVILISGNGSNLQAIIDAVNSRLLTVRIAAVISSSPSAYGLQRAAAANIATHVISPKNFSDSHTYDTALADYIKHHTPDLILLAGYMRIIGEPLLSLYKNKILNIHPSLLPKYPGLNTHAQALRDKLSLHGCSVHYVNENLDSGPLIAQAAVTLKHDDDVVNLKRRVQIAEHFLYPTILRWFAQGRITLLNNQVILDEIKLPPSGLRFLLKGL